MPATTNRRFRLRDDRGLATSTTVIIVAAVVLAAGIGGIVWFLSGDAPAEVDLERTAEAIASETTTTTTDAAAAATDTTVPDVTEAPSQDGIDGTWTVDTSIGEFSVTEDATASFAGFRVEEVLSSIGSTTAVGRTPNVSGSITIEDTTLTDAAIIVDLTAIRSDESRRENAIQGALGTASNPDAMFVLTESVDLGDAAASGDPISVIAVGDLTINGITNPVEVALDAQLIDDQVLVTGSTPVLFSDYNVSTPSAAIVVSVEDNGIIEFQLWLS